MRWTYECSSGWLRFQGSDSKSMPSLAGLISADGMFGVSCRDDDVSVEDGVVRELCNRLRLV